MRWISIVIALVVLAACAASERRGPEAPRARDALDAGTYEEESREIHQPRLMVPEDDHAPDGRACTRTDECGRGMQCRGAPGCTSDWACGEARTCMDEVVAYCDCDGSTFYARGGCAGRPYAHVGPCETMGELIAAGTELGIPDWDEQPTTQDRVCSSGNECGRNLTCFGIAGCATEWRCVRARGCTRDRVAYCGCDGQTFMASSTCPERPFLHRGACRGEAVASAEPARRTPARDERASSQSSQAMSSAPAPAAQSAAPQSAGQRGAQVCRSSRECPRGQVCQGPDGCGMTWTCGRPARRCIEDTQVFCDCEGRDFRASMFCPGRPYRHRGSCEIDRLLELSGAAPR